MKNINNNIKEIAIEDLKSISGGQVGRPINCWKCTKQVYIDELKRHDNKLSLYCPHCDALLFEEM